MYSFCRYSKAERININFSKATIFALQNMKADNDSEMFLEMQLLLNKITLLEFDVVMSLTHYRNHKCLSNIDN